MPQKPIEQSPVGQTPESPVEEGPVVNRRRFVRQGLQTVVGVAAGTMLPLSAVGRSRRASRMRFGLVTYQWGRDWNVPAIIRNCRRAEVFGVELRVEHAHGVSPDLSARERAEVRLRFENSPVELVGMGTNWAFHYPDPDRVRLELDGAKEYVRLSHDIGGTGVKVKPNDLPDGVSVDQTIDQIGSALHELGGYAGEYGQEIRVEVHGSGTQQLPIMRRIMESADHPNVTVCWNSNDEDLAGSGLVDNFNLVKDYFGSTVHVRELDSQDYPYSELMSLLLGIDYDGWILLEARTEPVDRIEALMDQRKIFDTMIETSLQASG